MLNKWELIKTYLKSLTWVKWNIITHLFSEFKWLNSNLKYPKMLILFTVKRGPKCILKSQYWIDSDVSIEN